MCQVIAVPTWRCGDFGDVVALNVSDLLGDAASAIRAHGERRGRLLMELDYGNRKTPTVVTSGFYSIKASVLESWKVSKSL